MHIDISWSASSTEPGGRLFWNMDGGSVIGRIAALLEGRSMTKGQIRAELGPVSDGTLKSSLHRLMERGAIRADRTEDGGYSYTRHAEGRRRARRLGPVDGPRTLRIVVSGN